MAKNGHYTAVIVGDSPASYICAIYLFTANISTVVIRQNLPLEYNCRFAPGLEAGKDEYRQKCYEQAKNMGIEVVEAEEFSIKKIRKAEDEKYVIKHDDFSVEADFVVSDVDIGQGDNKWAFVVDKMLLEREAIVVAGTGCMIAFHIKDIINS